MDAPFPQRSAPTPHITDLRFGAFIARAVRSPHAAFPLERVEALDQAPVRFHGLGDGVPELGV